MSIVPPNKTPREQLLERDVYIQFQEIRKLREENDRLKKEIEALKEKCKSCK